MLRTPRGPVLLLAGILAGCAAQSSSGRLSPPPTADEMLSLSLMHGLSAITYGAGSAEPGSQSTCQGSGADKAHAVQMSSINGKGQIKDVASCLQQLYPGARSGMQAFVVEDGRFFTVAHLKDSSGQEREVFFDITPWAEDFVRELRAKS